MGTIGSYEAKTHLPEMLKRTAQGEEIVITKHGVPVARLVPVSRAVKEAVRETIRELREFRKEHTLGGMRLRQMIDEGRRF